MVLGPEKIELASFSLKRDACEVNGAVILTLAALLDGVQRTVNPISAAL